LLAAWQWHPTASQENTCNSHSRARERARKSVSLSPLITGAAACRLPFSPQPMWRRRSGLVGSAPLPPPPLLPPPLAPAALPAVRLRFRHVIG
jgi:hypothetical protein